ncbi:MAG: AMP-binding protein, partial [Pseudorhodoplanes sp.]
MNLFNLLNQAADRFPDNGATYSGTECTGTFSQLRARALSIAGALQQQHAPGDRIAIVSENCPEYIEFMFGIWAAGLMAVPINAKLHVREMTDILLDCGATRIVASSKLAGELEPACKTALRGRARMVVIGSKEHAAMLRAAPAQPADVTPDYLAWLFYTSGTTGRSKGAMLSHRNLIAMAVAHLADIESADETMSLIHGAPMSHGSGLYILPYIARGARQVVPASGGFDAAEFLDLCDHHPSCCAFLAPTMVQRLRAEAERSGRRPTHLQTIVYGGAPMYVEELKRSIATFGPVFAQIYGQ